MAADGLYNSIENLIGKLCEKLIPIKNAFIIGDGRTIRIRTLSTLNLLEEISDDQLLMKKIAIARRLFTENKAVDHLLKYCNQNEELRHFIVFRIESKGHFAGSALISLFRYGVNSHGRMSNR